MLNFFLSHLFVLTATFFIGFLLYLNFFKKDSDRKGEICAWSFALAVPLLSVIHFVSFLADRDIRLTNLFIYGVVGGILLLRVLILKMKCSNPLNRFLFLFICFSTYLFLLLTILPNYFLAETYDWRIYYPVASFYLESRADFVLPTGVLFLEYLLKRTPFFSLTGSFFMSIIGNQYFHFQIIMSVFNGLIFWNVYLLAQEYYQKNVARMAILLLPLIPMFACRINFPITKPLLMFFILLSLQCYMRLRGKPANENRNRDQSLLIIFSISAFMVHPMALLYLIWIVLDQIYLWLRSKTHMLWSCVVKLFVFSTLLILPWYVWSVSTFGFDAVFIPPDGIREGGQAWLPYLGSRVTTILYSIFMPALRMIDVFTLDHAALTPGDNHLFQWGHFVLLTYFETLLWGFGIVMMIMFVSSLFRFKIKGLIPASYAQFLKFMMLGGLTVVLVNLKMNGAQAFNMLGAISLSVLIIVCSRMVLFSKTTQVLMIALIMIESIGIHTLMYHLTLIYQKLVQLMGAKEVPFLFEQVNQSSSNIFLLVLPLILGLACLYGYLLKGACQMESRDN